MWLRPVGSGDVGQCGPRGSYGGAVGSQMEEELIPTPMNVASTASQCLTMKGEAGKSRYSP